MRRFLVSIPYHASAFAEVEADSQDEAIGKAYEKVGIPSVCCHCSEAIEINEPNPDLEPYVEEILK